MLPRVVELSLICNLTIPRLTINLLTIMAEAEEGVQALSDSSFKKVFWEQQVHIICIGSTYLTMHPNPTKYVIVTTGLLGRNVFIVRDPRV